jgi:hypothetical protein
MQLNYSEYLSASMFIVRHTGLPMPRNTVSSPRTSGRIACPYPPQTLDLILKRLTGISLNASGFMYPLLN